VFQSLPIVKRKLVKLSVPIKWRDEFSDKEFIKQIRYHLAAKVNNFSKKQLNLKYQAEHIFFVNLKVKFEE
jgi:hypothetical protein